MSFIASMNALAGAKRRISAGNASTTSRGVTPCSFAAVSMTTPGAVASTPARPGVAITPPCCGDRASASPRSLRTSGGRDRAALRCRHCRRAHARGGTAPTWFRPRSRRGSPTPYSRNRARGPGLRTLEQMEFDEALQLMQIAVAALPHGLEGLFLAFDDLEAVHGDEHASLLMGTAGNRACGG